MHDMRKQIHYILRDKQDVQCNEYAVVHADERGDIYILDMFVRYKSICGVNVSCKI